MAVKSGEYPELRLKAWTSRVLTACLAVCLQELVRSMPAENRDPELVMATSAMVKLANWLLLIERCPRYMSAEQVANVDRACWEHLEDYSVVKLFVVFFRISCL